MYSTSTELAFHNNMKMLKKLYLKRNGHCCKKLRRHNT
jgi:hypothetical protein